MPKIRQIHHKNELSEARDSRLLIEFALPQAAIVSIFSFVIGASAVYGVTCLGQYQNQSLQQNQLIKQQCQVLTPTQQIPTLRRDTKH